MVFAGRSGALHHMTTERVKTERREIPNICGHSEHGITCGEPMHQDDYEDHIALGKVIRFSCRHGHTRTYCIETEQ